MSHTRETSNLFQALENARPDEAVGISIASLTEGTPFGLFAARLPAGAGVGAHYHVEGKEIYHILRGEGIMMRGVPGDGGSVEWRPSLALREGDVYTVEAGEVHQLRNSSDREELVVAFICSKSHMGEDRIMTEGAPPSRMNE